MNIPPINNHTAGIFSSHFISLYICFGTVHKTTIDSTWLKQKHIWTIRCYQTENTLTTAERRSRDLYSWTWALNKFDRLITEERGVISHYFNQKSHFGGTRVEQTLNKSFQNVLEFHAEWVPLPKTHHAVRTCGGQVPRCPFDSRTKLNGEKVDVDRSRGPTTS